MPQIPLIRSSQISPFLRFLEQIGSPTTKILRQANIPWLDFEKSNNLIPEYSVWSLLEQAARFERSEDLGLQVAMQTDLADVGLLGESLLKSPSLSDILNNFLNHIRWHSSSACFWLKIDHQEAWFCRQGIPVIEVGSTQVELYTLIYMIKVIQQITGQQWQPTKVYLQMKAMPSLSACPLLSEVPLFFNQQFTAISFPRHLLQQNREQSSKTKAALGQNHDSWQDNLPATDLSGAISQTIETLLPHQVTCIDTVAKLMGFSTRSLQRCLAQEELNYFELLKAVRREKAIVLLKDSTLNITDIGYQLGYSDSANFSRAFKEWTNFSPRYFRKKTLKIKLHNNDNS
ncbi:DNA-binding domain-containing protein, AraC-type [Xenococcus sp. PCC 7305]|uniref:AraC family transcriptional regulator n=1 Tax=Xenococcus sp. PCC 7305 TaxID=102125 RepID=UPI0002AC0D0A|nr:AraC family transcriptional regulator [Xenococcus sp. PCC 7305]ELS00687.1 DNA-binding domain-containing protein, AraC-type [Xenococcus sp. PCC 7305]